MITFSSSLVSGGCVKYTETDEDGLSWAQFEGGAGKCDIYRSNGRMRHDVDGKIGQLFASFSESWNQVIRCFMQVPEPVEVKQTWRIRRMKSSE